MRAQTRTNRTLGINAGRERRAATSNREEVSHERRAEVFRQDVVHTGVEPIDARRAHSEAMWKLVVELAGQNKTLNQIAKATGFALTTVRNYLSKHKIACGNFKPQSAIPRRKGRI